MASSVNINLNDWQPSNNFSEIFSAHKKLVKISLIEQVSKDYFLILVNKISTYDYGLQLYQSVIILSNIFVTLSSVIAIIYPNKFITWQNLSNDFMQTSHHIVYLFINLWNLILLLITFKVDESKIHHELNEMWDNFQIGHKPAVIDYVKKEKHFLLLGLKLMAICLIITSCCNIVNLSKLSDIFAAILMQLFFIINHFVYISMLFQLVMICICIRSSFNFLQSRISRANVKQMDINAVRNYRTIFARTIDMIRKANTFWRQFIFFYYIFFVLINVTILYNLFYISNSLVGHLSFFILLSFGAISLFIITYTVSGIHGYAIKIYPDIYRLTLGDKCEEFLIEVRVLFLYV